MNEVDFLARVNSSPSSISFDETMSCIETNYKFDSCSFKVGEQENAAGQNQGSCKILAFAQLHQLDEKATLNLFGDYYRIDVLVHPNADDHRNIRNFAKTGWAGVTFDRAPLKKI
jgi:HopJ type III effector protein